MGWGEPLKPSCGQDRGPRRHIPAWVHVPATVPTAWGNASAVPSAVPSAGQPALGEGLHPEAPHPEASRGTSVATARAGKRGQPPAPRKAVSQQPVSFSSQGGCGNLFVSTSAVRTGKIPPCSQEHHQQVSQSFLLRQEIKQSMKVSSSAGGGTQGPGHIAALGLGSLPACMATSTGRAGNALPESASQLPAAHPRSNAPRRLLSRSRDPITAPETGQGRSSPKRCESWSPAARAVPRRAGERGRATQPFCSAAGFFCQTLLSNQHSSRARSGQPLFQLERETKNAKGRFTRQYDQKETRQLISQVARPVQRTLYTSLTRYRPGIRCG